MRRIKQEEPDFFHLHKGEIEYHQVKGDLWYSYLDRVESKVESGATRISTYKARGVIPQEIIEKGEITIREFAKSEVDEKINSQKEFNNQIDEHRKNLSFPIELQYEEILLRGRIKSLDGTVLTAELLEPYQGESHLQFGFASAMSGHYIFGRDGLNFSDYAIKRAEGLLVGVYHKEKEKAENPWIGDLVERLNKERR